MTRVVAIILHAVPGAAAGPLEEGFAATRATNADRLARGFNAAGAGAEIVATHPGGAPFGTRLRQFATREPRRGLVILGSGSLPLAGPADLQAFVATAGAGEGPVLTNNRYSGDVLAIPAGIDLSTLPDLEADNGVPRWFAEKGVRVNDLRSRWRLQVDLETPIDALVADRDRPGDPTYDRVRPVVERFRRLAADPRSEILVAGRTSATTLRWLETHTASRTRALVEERGMRTAPPDQRPARSALGLLLDRD